MERGRRRQRTVHGLLGKRPFLPKCQRRGAGRTKVIGEGKDARTEHVEISYTYDINNPTYSDMNPSTSRQPGQPEVQPMNRLIRVLRDRRGESMVEILVSTVVFMLLLGALNGAVGFASNAQRNSEQLRRERPNCRKACAEMQKSRTAKLPHTILR